MKGYIVSSDDIHWHDKTMTDADLMTQRLYDKATTYTVHASFCKREFDDVKILSPKEFGQAKLNRHKRK